MDQHHIQLADPACRGSFATEPKDEDGSRLIDNMCPSLYRAVQKGRMQEVMALLLQQHGAATNNQGSGNTQLTSLI